jgi:hypothetical protein
MLKRPALEDNRLQEDGDVRSIIAARKLTTIHHTDAVTHVAIPNLNFKTRISLDLQQPALPAVSRKRGSRFSFALCLVFKRYVALPIHLVSILTSQAGAKFNTTHARAW